MLAEAATAAQSTRSEVLTALRQASAATGSDFDYLLGTAMRESSLKPQAKSTSSSASGLFQFVEQTWLGMIKQYGDKYGLGSYADAIHKTASGHYRADNAADRRAILALRNDPKVSALMAGEYANETKNQLESRLGRNICGGELYAAHFLGPGAACRLIELSDNHPTASAAAAFPTAAAANRSVFYHRDGSAKSVREVYNWALKQPKVSTRAMAETEMASATNFAVPSLADPASLFASPRSGTADSWSTLSLFNTPTKADPLVSPMTLPQAPFVLTPGVVSVLASLGPADEPDAEKRNAG
jgi:hypothetical protein